MKILFRPLLCEKTKVLFLVKRKEMKMKTGFKDLDNIIDMEEGDLIVIGTRPTMRKDNIRS